MNDTASATRIIRKLFWSLLPVQAMAVGLPAINALLDTAIVGNLLGPDALAAMGFTGPLTKLLVALSSMVATGAQLLSGQSLGKGDKQGVNRIFSTALLLCIVLGFGFAAVMLLFPVPIARMLGATGENIATTAAYIRGWSGGMAFSMLLSCVLPFAQMERMGKLSTVSVIVMLLVNLGFDVANTVVFHQGVFGVGLATTYSNIAAAAVVLPYLLLKSKTFRFAPGNLSAKTAGQILYQGAPNAVAPLCLLVRDRVLNQFIFALGGTAAMSAAAIANNVKSAVGNVVEAGYTGSARLVASVLVGERDSSSLRDLPRVMVRSAWSLYVIAYGFIFVFAKPLVQLFGADAEHIRLYVMILRVFNLFYLTNIFKSPPQCIYQAMGKVNLLMVMTVLGNTVFPVCTCLLLGNALGLPLVFATNSISEILLMVFMASYFTYQAKRLPRSLTELAYIPSTVSAPRENRMKAVLHTVDDCVKAAAEAEQFCLQKGIPQQKAMYCGLCIEEMAVDAVSNRFPNDHYTLDLRLIYEDGTMTILLRDDCPQFDPNAWLTLCRPEDESRSIGIRMVQKLAKEMNYASTLGLNVLTIRI